MQPHYLHTGKYLSGDLIGVGCAGSFYRVARFEDQVSFAMKICRARDIEDPAIQQAFKEVAIMKKLLIQNGEYQEV